MNRIAVSERSDTMSRWMSPSQLQCICDTMFATVAILLVMPLNSHLVDDIHKSEFLGDTLVEKMSQILVFIVGFQVICISWETHLLRNKILRNVDDFLVFCTLLSLLFVTLLPFSIALEGQYAKNQLAVVVPCMNLLALELINMLMFIYAFHNPRLLTTELTEQGLDESEIYSMKLQVIAKVIINCITFILAAAFSTTSLVISWVLICLFIFNPLLKRCVTSACCRDNPRPYRNVQLDCKELLIGNVMKANINHFTNTVVAIIAAILILNITISKEFFPSMADVNTHGLGDALKRMWKIFVGYIGCFLTVFILWFVHHSVLHQLKLLTPFMILCNNIFLNFLAGIPFIYTLLNLFAGEPTYNQRIAVRVSSVIGFIAGFMDLTMFVYAYLQKGTHLHNWAIPGGDRGFCAHTYILCKTLIIPVTTFLTFCSTLVSNYVSFVVLNIFLFIVPFLFIILKIVYVFRCRSDNFQHSELDEESWHDASAVLGETGASEISPNQELARNTTNGLPAQLALGDLSDQTQSEKAKTATASLTIDSQKNKLKWRSAKKKGMTLLELSMSFKGL